MAGRLGAIGTATADLTRLPGDAPTAPPSLRALVEGDRDGEGGGEQSGRDRTPPGGTRPTGSLVTTRVSTCWSPLLIHVFIILGSFVTLTLELFTP